MRSALRLAATLGMACTGWAVSCSSEDEPSAEGDGPATDAGVEGGDAGPPPPVYDDDTDRIAHCAFEGAPERAALPALDPGAVRAGLGSSLFALPVGVPLGGYGDRLRILDMGTPVDDRARRWAGVMVPSAGVQSAPRVDALALEAAGELVVLVQVDSSIVVDDALFAVEEKVAPDGSMRGRILLTASHGHASWAAWMSDYAHIAAYDRPRRDLFDRAVDAIAEAATEALGALEPARIGFAVDGSFDPELRVSADRRSQNDDVVGPDGNVAGQGKDPVVWALRVDRADGAPLAAVLDLPVHPTVGAPENPLVSTDVAGAIERALSAELGYPVIHVQGAAGDVAPTGNTGRAGCSDPVRCLDVPRIEALGARAADLTADLIRDIETSDRWALEVVTRSFYVGKSGVVRRPNGTELGYAPYDPDRAPDGVVFDEHGAIVSPIDEFNVAGGAGLCGGVGGAYTPIPDAPVVGGYSSCNDIARGIDFIAQIFELADDTEVPFCETLRATATAVRFTGGAAGDYLLLGLPGEPTAPFTAYLRSRSPAPSDRTLVLGYASDYVGYLLTAEDWLASGYEPGPNVWGPLEGELVLDGALTAAEIAWTPEREDPEAGSSRFVDFEFPPSDPVDPIATTDPGTVPSSLPPLFLPDTTVQPTGAQPEPSVPRIVGAARFVWLGGDPAVDFPEVVVERETAPGAFEPLLDASGRPASSFDGAVVITYTPDPLDAEAPSSHYYAATWQPVPPDPFSLRAPNAPYGLPTGRYRLKAVGTALTASGTLPYAIASSPFDVTVAPLGSGTATRGASQLDVSALLGTAPGLRALRDGISDRDVPLPAPWTVTVSLDDASTVVQTVMPDGDGRGVVPLTAADVARAVAVEVRDPAGNGGVITVQ